ncbi:PIG-L family deacetylase [Brevibacillus fluminis]|nr:PIG-L family deacetylase [Brevibacillus fluminis]
MGNSEGSTRSLHGLIDLWTAIKPLSTIASAMNTGAHPDDEHSAMLAYLSLGKGVSTSSIIATRGEGGQNEIGCELGNALGIIRTRELEEASKACNVTLGVLSESPGDAIHDFGFSKSADETFRKWGETVVYERLIRKIRELRPDVVIQTFLNEPTTHGHHRAIAILTSRAFTDAADPLVFPEHEEKGLKPWQIKKLYSPADADDYHVAVPVGDYDQTYGASYLQLGEDARFMHKSQGMGVHYDEGPTSNYYKLESSIHPVKDREPDYFDGIAFTFEDLALEIAALHQQPAVIKSLLRLHADAAEVLAAYPRFAQVAFRVHQMKATLADAIEVVRQSGLTEEAKVDVLHRLSVKEAQLNRASREALSLVVKLKPESGELVAGQTTRMAVTVYNGGSIDVLDLKLRLQLPEDWRSEPLTEVHIPKLGYNQTGSATFEVMVPAAANEFRPYEPPAAVAVVQYAAFGTESFIRVAPDMQVAVLPAYSLTPSPAATILNTLHASEEIDVKVAVKNYRSDPSRTVITLDVPNGWSVEPATCELSFSFQDETKSAAFTVRPGSTVENGQYMIRPIARLTDGTIVSDKDVRVIEYPHIRRTYHIQPAQLTIQAFDLRIPHNQRVGYVSSGFDNIDRYLRQIGVNCVNLEVNEIQYGDLSQYDTIVLGIRAYGFLRELTCCNQRLMQYVENGGNLVVQYHKPEDKWKKELAPYPIVLGESLIDWRVTDENSPITVLAPDHPVFHTPNLITADDWRNWVHERSIYNPARWGSEYCELIATSDPGEPEFRGIFLTAPYGKGTYTYSSLAWFREIPALVPGAIRMFVNMISLKR